MTLCTSWTTLVPTQLACLKALPLVLWHHWKSQSNIEPTRPLKHCVRYYLCAEMRASGQDFKEFEALDFGEWEALPGGVRWHLALHSPGASSLALLFR